jgi:hypothetical protein
VNRYCIRLTFNVSVTCFRVIRSSASNLVQIATCGNAVCGHGFTFGFSLTEGFPGARLSRALQLGLADIGVDIVELIGTVAVQLSLVEVLALALWGVPCT